MGRLSGRLEQDPAAPEIESEYLMLARIKSTCDQIEDIFNALERRGVYEADNELSRSQIEANAGTASLEVELTQSERVTLRKAWEIGV